MIKWVPNSTFCDYSLINIYLLDEYQNLTCFKIKSSSDKQTHGLPSKYWRLEFPTFDILTYFSLLKIFKDLESIYA